MDWFLNASVGSVSRCSLDLRFVSIGDELVIAVMSDVHTGQ
jgi:hypothetical protein